MPSGSPCGRLGRATWPIFGLALALAIAGCGGSGSSASDPFSGEFAGQWTAGAASGQGSFVFTSDGQISSAYLQTQDFSITRITGSVSRTGVFVGELTPAGGQQTHYTGLLTVQGQMLTGTIAPATGSAGTTYTLSMTANSDLPGGS